MRSQWTSWSSGGSTTSRTRKPSAGRTRHRKCLLVGAAAGLFVEDGLTQGETVGVDVGLQCAQMCEVEGNRQVGEFPPVRHFEVSL